MSVNTRVFYREISNVGTVGNARVRVARRERPRTSRGDTDSRVPTHVFIEFRALRAYITRVDQREKDRLRIHLGEDGANSSTRSSCADGRPIDDGSGWKTAASDGS